MHDTCHESYDIEVQGILCLRRTLIEERSSQGPILGRRPKNWPTAKNMYRSTAMDEKVEKEAEMPSFFLDKK
jgi:hypothetical protein